MPWCSIKGCTHGSMNLNITKHQLPKNPEKSRKWLEIIGEENINFLHKIIYICSAHFEKSCFNHTLNITKLHDDALPSRFLLPSAQSSKLDNCNSVQHIIDSKKDIKIQYRPNKSVNQLNMICERQRKKIRQLQKMVSRLKKRVAHYQNKERNSKGDEQLNINKILNNVIPIIQINTPCERCESWKN